MRADAVEPTAYANYGLVERVKVLEFGVGELERDGDERVDALAAQHLVEQALAAFRCA